MRTSARAVRIAVSGVGCHRAEHVGLGPQHATSARQSPPRAIPARHPAGPCPGRALPAACATAPVPPIARCPVRTCGPSRPAAPSGLARSSLCHRPRRGHAGTTRCACSPGECFLPCSQQDPGQVPSLQVRGTLRLFDQGMHEYAYESARLGIVALSIYSVGIGIGADEGPTLRRLVGLIHELLRPGPAVRTSGAHRPHTGRAAVHRGRAAPHRPPHHQEPDARRGAPPRRRPKSSSPAPSGTAAHTRRPCGSPAARHDCGSRSATRLCGEHWPEPRTTALPRADGASGWWRRCRNASGSTAHPPVRASGH